MLHTCALLVSRWPGFAWFPPYWCDCVRHCRVSRPLHKARKLHFFKESRPVGCTFQSPTDPIPFFNVDRSTRKPAPSPLHTTSSALSSPPTSPGPTRSGFCSPLHETYTAAAAAANVPQIVTTAAPDDGNADPSEKTYFNSDSSGANTPEDRRSPAYVF